MMRFFDWLAFVILMRMPFRLFKSGFGAWLLPYAGRHAVRGEKAE